MAEDRKKIVSVRMSSSDLAKVKTISERLYIKESDLYRFAMKNLLGHLAPLYDVNAQGRDLLPAFFEYGIELSRQFDIDADHLDQLINGFIDDESDKVEREDLELLAMSGQATSYIMIKLQNVLNQEITEVNFKECLKSYLYTKYVDNGVTAGNNPDAVRSRSAASSRAVVMDAEEELSTLTGLEID